MPKLTVGMAHYEDFHGVYFTIQAARLFHPEVANEIEFIVVDQSPDSAHGQAVKQFVEGWVPHARYILGNERIGTAAPRDRVFREASAEFVLCIDCHVLLAPGSLARLIEWADDYPTDPVLVHGPMLLDNLHEWAAKLDPVWRDGMWGIWANDSRADDIDGPPFEIVSHGCGLFGCHRDHWLGFNERFEGFGGEEGYLQEKYRRAGGRVLCLPFLRWLHRFGRPDGAKYPLSIRNKLRNHLIGTEELGLSPLDALKHFIPMMNPAELGDALKSLWGAPPSAA